MLRVLLAFFLLFHGLSAFHYTCEQMRDDLIPNRVEIHTTYACAVFEDKDRRPAFYDTVFIEDLSRAGTRYSLNTVYDNCTFCMQGGPWIVTSDEPIPCYMEVTLLFTSASSFISVHGDDRWDMCNNYNKPLTTIVQPNCAATTFDSFSCNGKATQAYMGIGKDESEEMYLIRDSSEPFDVISFGCVTTIAMHGCGGAFGSTASDDRSSFVYLDDQNHTTTIRSSSILGNEFWKNDLRIDVQGINYKEDPIIHVTGYVQFNSSNYISLILPTRAIDLVDSGYIDVTTVGKLQVYYNTHTAPYVNARVNESFELNFELMGYNTPTVTPVTVTTTAAPNIETSQSYCLCDLDEEGIAKRWASQIWLDIVILIDTSQSMGTDGVNQVSQLVESFTGMMNLDSNGPNDLYSRVGLISLANTVQVVYNLNMTSDSDVDLKKSDVASVDIAAGFQAALEMFQAGTKMPNYRPSAKQIIYFITNSDPKSILNGVNEFKTSGGIIIVSDFVREGQVPVDGLKSLASPNYFFTSLTDNYNYNLKVLCDANCYCPPNLHPFTDESINVRQTANRGCFHVENSGLPYKNGLKACQKADSVMASIHDDDKQFFLNSMVAEFGPKTKYWIPYQNDGSKWNWIDNSTNPYTNWDNGQPNLNGGNDLCAYAVQTTGFNSKWYAANCNGGYFSVCEKAPCAAGSYCTFDD